MKAPSDASLPPGTQHYSFLVCNRAYRAYRAYRFIVTIVLNHKCNLEF